MHNKYMFKTVCLLIFLSFGSVAMASDTSINFACKYIEDIYKIKNNGCGQCVMCSSKVRCNLNIYSIVKQKEFKVYCSTDKNGKCPAEGTDCALDNSITEFQDPKDSDSILIPLSVALPTKTSGKGKKSSSESEEEQTSPSPQKKRRGTSGIR